MGSSHYEYKNQTGKSVFKIIDEDLVYVERDQTYSKNTTVIDVFPNNWFIGLISESYELLSIRSGDNTISFDRSMGILIPPFKISEWKIKPGHLLWAGFFFQKPMPEVSFTETVLFDWNGVIPSSRIELEMLIHQIQVRHQIAEAKTSSWIAEKTKSVIDNSFTEEIKVEDIASLIRVDRSIVTRSFKKTYGINPVEYRHLLRVFEGIRLMNQQRSKITVAAFEAGFLSLNRFEHHFKKKFSVAPIDFNFNKKTGQF